VPELWAENPRLGRWVGKQRTLKRKLDRGEPSEGMTAARAARLTALGFEWLAPPQLAKDIPVAGMGNFRCPHFSQIVLSVLGATALKWRLDGCSGVGGMQCKKFSIEMVEEREQWQQYGYVFGHRHGEDGYVQHGPAEPKQDQQLMHGLIPQLIDDPRCCSENQTKEWIEAHAPQGYTDEAKATMYEELQEYEESKEEEDEEEDGYVFGRSASMKDQSPL
jgi:hypothetical protein